MAHGYVIKDGEGGFIAPRVFTLTDEGWLYCAYTGKADGFTFYSSENTAKEDLAKYERLINKYNFNKKFHIEYIEDIQIVKKGKLLIEDLFYEIDS